MEISNHTFIVTGGGSGLGAAASRLLVELGANVAIADIDREKGAALAKTLGGKTLFHPTDVADEIQTGEAMRLAREKFGAIHGLVNCAGILVAGRVLEKEGGVFPLERFRRGIEVNLVGAFNALRLASRSMMDNLPNEEGERGVIINTASIAAFEGQIGQACYSAAKAGIVGMTLPIARELARFGIRVMTIAPGLFDTPLLAALPAERLVMLKQQAPFPPRLGKPPEFAALVRHIIENPMLNGSVIRLDGAVRMTAK